MDRQHRDPVRLPRGAPRAARRRGPEGRRVPHPGGGVGRLGGRRGRAIAPTAGRLLPRRTRTQSDAQRPGSPRRARCGRPRPRRASCAALAAS